MGLAVRVGWRRYRRAARSKPLHVLALPLVLFVVLVSGSVLLILHAATVDARLNRSNAKINALAALDGVVLSSTKASLPGLQLAQAIRQAPDVPRLMEDWTSITSTLWSQQAERSAQVRAVFQGSCILVHPNNERTQAYLNQDELQDPQMKQELLHSMQMSKATLSGPFQAGAASATQSYQDQTLVLHVPVFISNVSSPNETWGGSTTSSTPTQSFWDPDTQVKWWGAVVVEMSFASTVGDPGRNLLDGHELQLTRRAHAHLYEIGDTTVWSTLNTPCSVGDACAAAALQVTAQVFNNEFTMMIWKVGGWYPAYRMPTIISAVIASFVLALLVMMLMVAWCEQHMGIRRLLPHKNVDKVLKRLMCDSQNANQDLFSLQNGTPAIHMLEMIKYMMAGVLPKLEQMLVVHEALAMGRDVYRPLREDVGQRIQAAEHIDNETRQALMDQLLGRDAQEAAHPPANVTGFHMSVTGSTNRSTPIGGSTQGVEPHRRPPSLSLDLDLHEIWSQDTSTYTTSSRPKLLAPQLRAMTALKAVPEGIHWHHDEDEDGVALTCSTCQPHANPALDAWAASLACSDVFANVEEALGHLMRSAAQGTSTSSNVIPGSDALIEAVPEHGLAAGSSDQQWLPRVAPPAHTPLLHLELYTSKFSLWSFDAFKLDRVTNGHSLSVLGFWVLHKSQLIKELGLHEVRLARFLRAVEAAYPDNPYHNRRHAADVLQKMFVLLTTGGVGFGYADKLTSLACYLAAIVHDVEHVGRSNGYLVATQHPLAIRYNDRSPMENHHLAAAWQVLRNPDFDFLAGLPAADRNKLRKLVIELVLGTDMQQHFSICSQWSVLLNTQQSEAANASHRMDVRSSKRLSSHGNQGTAPRAPVMHISETERLLGLQMAFKCADLGHLAAPLPVHLKWVSSLEAEFFLQGDVERAQGLPISPFCDRSKEGVGRSQVGFFEIVVLPLVSLFASRFPAASPLLKAVKANYAYYTSGGNAIMECSEFKPNRAGSFSEALTPCDTGFALATM